MFAQPLSRKQTFDWEAYREVAESGQRSLEVDLPTGRITVPFDVYDDIAELLRALPSVDVWNDSGPDDNPARVPDSISGSLKASSALMSPIKFPRC